MLISALAMLKGLGLGLERPGLGLVGWGLGLRILAMTINHWFHQVWYL